MTRGAKIGKTSIPALSANFQVTRNTIAEDSFGIATQGSINGGTYTASGSISAAYRPFALRDIVNLVLGGTDKINTTGAFSTTSIDIEDDYGNVTSFATGAVVNSLELSLATEDYARITFNFTGIKKAAAPGSLLAALYTEDLAVFYNAKITIAAATVYAKSLTVRVERPLTPDYIIGSEYANTLNQSGNVTVSGTIGLAANEYTQLYNALTTLDESNSQPNETNVNSLSGGALVIDLRHPDSRAFQTITISNIKITTGSQSGDGRQVMTKSVDFTAVVSSDSVNIIFGDIT